jgi:hypothetical protein
LLAEEEVLSGQAGAGPQTHDHELEDIDHTIEDADHEPKAVRTITNGHDRPRARSQSQ